MTKKNLHIAGNAKFIPPFIKCINEQFKSEHHEFLLAIESFDNDCMQGDNVRYFLVNTMFSRIKYHLNLIIKMHQADNIILHGLFSMRLVQMLFFMPWLLKKVYWFIWGGDLYAHNNINKNVSWRVKEFFRRPVIKNIGHLVTYIKGDIDLARNWYNAKGDYHECLMYESNLYKDYDVPNIVKKKINIQVGNSADPSNNHLDVLKKLLPFRDRDICIYVPLSYGSNTYAESVITTGKEWFGEKFKPITEIMPFEKYLSFLGSIDIAIFNHKRQQAMGNTITLLGLGKTVYLRSDTTQWSLFKDKGILVRDVLDFENLDFYSNNNVELIKKNFSTVVYHQQLKNLFT